jgi:hypothetical protein
MQKGDIGYKLNSHNKNESVNVPEPMPSKWKHLCAKQQWAPSV